ncbi:MAG: dockerin type I repeat-containing protein, partial [Bacilli bacterium]
VWNVGNENAEYKISDDGQKITAKIINVISDNVQNQILNLKVLNGENGTVLKPTITIKIGSAGDTKVISPELIPSTSIVSTNVDNSELRIKLVNGNSYNKTGFTGRYVPFGILVGFENQKGDVDLNGKLEKNDVQLIIKHEAQLITLTAEQQKIADLTGDAKVTSADAIKLLRYITYPNENDINLEGMYFNLKNLDLIMEMNQKEEGVNTYYPIELSDNETDYGLYKTSMDLFDKMPNSTMYLFDNITNTSVLQKDFVYDSGEVSKLQIASPSGEVIKNSSSSFSLLGGNKQTLTVGNSYKEMGVSFDGINSVSCIAANNCTTTYTLNEKKVDSIASNAEAIYKITYEYVNPETKEISKVIRIVTYVNKKEVTLAGKKYSMAGHENLYLLKNEKYIESGVLRDGVKFNGESGITYTTTIKDFKNVETTVIDTSKSGKYTVTYTLKKQVCVPPTVCATPPCANTCNDEVITLTRNVIITDPIATPVLEANDIYIAYKNPGGFDNNKAPFIINGNESATCETPGNTYNCNSKLEGFSTNKAGTYRTVYTVTSMDTGFSSTVSRNINVVLKYKMIISNIKTDGSFYRSDCFLAIGSYFVTAKSERTNNFMGNYNLKLDVNSVVNESALNYYFDEGKKSSNLALYKKENSSLTEMKESEAISYGETVVLKSTFKYSKSGDKKLNKVTTTINIPNKQFNLLSYYSDEAKSEYYLTVNDKAKTIEDGNIKYFYEGNAQGVSYIDLPKDAIITNVEYTLKDVKPGSDIDFRLKLKTISANSETEVTLNSRSTWECDYQNGYVPIITEVTVNSKKALITAFKARTNLTINESSANAFIDSTKSQKIHLAVYPTVTSPGLFVQTNLVGSLNTVDISVELPDGIHYMYNEEYILPVSTSVKDGKTMLQYRLYNQTFNNWMDIIDIDVRIDINVKNGSKLPIVSTIQATTSNGTTDASTDSARKLTKQITYTNSEEVVYAQFPSSSSINKNGSFNIITDLYNSTENVKTNLELVTVLPYNGLGDKPLYTGSYEITPNNIIVYPEQ